MQHSRCIKELLMNTVNSCLMSALKTNLDVIRVKLKTCVLNLALSLTNFGCRKEKLSMFTVWHLYWTKKKEKTSCYFRFFLILRHLQISWFHKGAILHFLFSSWTFPCCMCLYSQYWSWTYLLSISIFYFIYFFTYPYIKGKWTFCIWFRRAELSIHNECG